MDWYDISERAWLKKRREALVLHKLREHGISIHSPDAELRKAFEGTVNPSTCLRVAQEIRARTP